MFVTLLDRAERRVLKVTAVAAGLAFAHATQAIQIVRRRWPLNGKKCSTETVYAVTSPAATQARRAELAAIVRGHLLIEDRLHWVRSPGVLSLPHDVAPECGSGAAWLAGTVTPGDSRSSGPARCEGRSA
jgi:hypothetical protein